MINNIIPEKCIFQINAYNIDTLFKNKILQIGLSENDVCTIRNSGEIILDFGKEVYGGIRILTSMVEGEGKVRLVFGESVNETLSDILYKNSTNDHSVRDTVLEVTSLSDFSYGKTGFRFVRIKTVNDTKIEIKSIVAESVITDKRFVGKFECDNKLVNDIFNTASYTIKLCVQNGVVWDGVKRDKLVWVGDLGVENRVLSYLTDIKDEMENSLLFIKEQTPLPNWMNGIPAYSMWWVIVLWDKYLKDGDKDFLNNQKDYVLGVIGLIDKNITENGETVFDYNFIDVHTHYLTEYDCNNGCEAYDNDEEKKSDELSGIQAITKMCLDSAENIFNELGVNNKCKQIKSILVSNRKNVIRYKSISALRVVSNIANTNDSDILDGNGNDGISTFMSYFIFKAMSKIGKTQKAFELMQEYYGAMLNVGSTTFWEDFDLSWVKNGGRIDVMPDSLKTDIHGDYGLMCSLGYRKSLCHGWASGVIAFLIEEIAGIKIIEPKCKKIEIKPNLCGLNRLNVCIPTPYGNVEVYYNKEAEGNVKTTVKSPNEVQVWVQN